MISKALLFRFPVFEKKDREIERALEEAMSQLNRNSEAKASFAFRTASTEYGLFTIFENEQALESYRTGEATRFIHSVAHFTSGEADISVVHVLAHKLLIPVFQPTVKALLLKFKAKENHIQQVENFLREAKQFVDAETETTAWFALHFGNGDYGIFDVFPDNSARLKHMVGQVPQQMLKHAGSLLGGLPDMEMLSVFAEYRRNSA
jgi:hypothetical protein